MTDKELRNKVLERLENFLADDLPSIGWWDGEECDIDLDKVREICEKVKITIEE